MLQLHTGIYGTEVPNECKAQMNDISKLKGINFLHWTCGMWVPCKQKKTSVPQRAYYAINRGLQKKLQVYKRKPQEEWKRQRGMA